MRQHGGALTPRTYLALFVLVLLILACGGGTADDWRRLVRSAQNGYPNSPQCERGCLCGGACISCEERCWQ